MGIKFSQLPVFEQPTPGDYLAVLDSTASILKRSSITNLIAKNLGQIETSATAAYVHVEGEYFMFMNQFVKCTVDISVSDTIAIGTNVTAANVADALNQISGGLAGGTFVGTAYDWSQLTDAQKDKYILVNITDDDPYLIGGHDISGIADGTVSGALVQLNSDLGAKSSASSVTGNDAFAKINTLGTDLGAKSSASAVTGDDAFAKIATLNSDLDTQIGYYTTPSNLSWITPWYDGSTNSFGFVLAISNSSKFEIRFSNNEKKLYARYYNGSSWQTLVTYTGA